MHLMILLLTLLALTRLDGHKVWINKEAIATVQGSIYGEAKGTKTTLTNGQFVVVRENVNEVIRAIRSEAHENLPSGTNAKHP